MLYAPGCAEAWAPASPPREQARSHDCKYVALVLILVRERTTGAMGHHSLPAFSQAGGLTLAPCLSEVFIPEGAGPLAGLEAIIAVSGAGEAIEALLPGGVRSRQLHAGTLLAGKMLALADRRPAHLTEALSALLALPEHDQKRLGVIENWRRARTSSPTGKPGTRVLPLIVTWRGTSQA